MKNNNWFDENIEELRLQRWHKNWVMFTEFMLDIIIRILIVVAIGLVIISLSSKTEQEVEKPIVKPYVPFYTHPYFNGEVWCWQEESGFVYDCDVK